MDAIKRFIQTGDKFAQHSGVELVAVDQGHAVTRLTVQPWHLNAVGLVHGGAIFTLADVAFAAACNSHGTTSVGINVSITYPNAARDGVLTADAREVSCNPKLASYTVTVTDAGGQTIAIFQGLSYRKRDPIPGAAGGAGT